MVQKRMERKARAAELLRLNSEGLLSEVVGFETDEVAECAYGATVHTLSGATYLDFTGGIAVHACGHCHPDVVRAIAEQAGRVLHVSDTMRNGPQLELANWMRQVFEAAMPGEPWCFLLMNSGSESIDSAAKLAIRATGKPGFIAMEGAFHGRTLFATALSHSRRVHWEAYEPVVSAIRSHIRFAPAPRPESYGGRERSEACAEGVEAMLRDAVAPVAAVIIEAQQGEGGYFPMAPSAARRIREVTRKHGALLIADEIQSGWGRTGKWFGVQHLGIQPDIVVFGKASGGGLPLAGIAARQSLMGKWQPGEHGTTFGGNPVCCAAGLACLKVIERENLVCRAAAAGERVFRRLRPLVGSNGVYDVRGLGLMIGIEIRTAEGSPDYARCDEIKRRARGRGLLVLTCGARVGLPDVDNSTVRLIPPLNISDEELDLGLDILKDVLSKTAAQAA